MKQVGKGIGGILARGSSASFVVSVAGTAIMFVLHLYLARNLGVEQYGTYAYVLAWVSMLILASLVGLDTALVRFVADLHQQNRWSECKGIQQFSTKVVLLLGLIIAAGVDFAVLLYREILGTELAVTLALGVWSVPVAAITVLRQAVLRAMRYVGLAGLPRSVIYPSVLFLGAVLFFGQHPGAMQAWAVMLLDVCAAVIALMIADRMLRARQPQQLTASEAIYRQRAWLAVSLPMYIVSGMYVLLGQIDTVMIGWMLDKASAGIYAVANRAAGLIAFGVLAVNSIAGPMVAQYYHAGHRAELQQIARFAAMGAAIFSFISGGLVVTFGDDILQLLGASFVEGYGALVLLSVAQMINAIVGSVGMLLTMTGHERQAAAILTVVAAFNIVLDFVLIPHWGIQGAALATILSTATWNVAMWHVVHRRIRINPSVIPLG